MASRPIRVGFRIGPSSAYVTPEVPRELELFHFGDSRARSGGGPRPGRRPQSRPVSRSAGSAHARAGRPIPTAGDARRGNLPIQSRRAPSLLSGRRGRGRVADAVPRRGRDRRARGRGAGASDRRSIGPHARGGPAPRATADPGQGDHPLSPGRRCRRGRFRLGWRCLPGATRTGPGPPHRDPLLGDRPAALAGRHTGGLRTRRRALRPGRRDARRDPADRRGPRRRVPRDRRVHRAGGDGPSLGVLVVARRHAHRLHRGR